jgi:hypothetical protein
LTSGTSLVVGISASSGSEILDGFAEVPLLQPPAAVHENPEMRALLVNGVELPADGSGVLPAGTKVRLEPVQASGTDPLNFTFFATDGDVDSLRSADQTVTGEPADPSIDYTVPVSPGEVRFWVVVRDGRGGVGWLTRTAQVR